MSNVIDSIRPGLNAVLSVRDKIGAAKAPVFIVTRTWSGVEVGDGEMSETKQAVIPSPRIVDYSHSLRMVDGGVIKQGDLILKAISTVTFPLECEIDGSSTSNNVEKFYEIGGILYVVISVTKKYLTWNVQVRRISAQGRT